MLQRIVVTLTFLQASVLAGCQHLLKPLQERTLEGVQKPGSNSVGNARPISSNEVQPQLYIKKSDVSVSEKAQSESGSLFDVDDKRNFLIVPRDPLAEGSFIDFVVVYTRKEPSEGEGAAVDPNAPPTAPVSQEGMSEEEKKILAGLPNLEPAKSKLVPIRFFKMQVVSRRPNGDYDLRYQRDLVTSDQSYGLLITATLPHEKAITPEVRRTLDLTNVSWTESRDGKVESKQSPGWDDEYSFRMSGFSELKSKEAIALEEKRQQLESARKAIETQLQQMGKERNNVAETRATVAKEKQEVATTVTTLERAIEDRDRTIADQRDELDSLKNESKPGAQKDAASGK